MRQIVSLLAITLGASSCLWYDPMTTVVEPLRPSRPNTVAGRRAEAEAALAKEDDPLGLPAGVTLSVSNYKPAPSIHVVLPGDIHFITRPWDTTISGRTAHLRFTLRNHNAELENAAIAILTAHVIADAPRASEGKQSLRNGIEDLGGTLKVNADTLTSSFAITLPHENWQAGLKLLVDAVQATPVSRPQADRIQERLVRELSKDDSIDPLPPTLQRIVGRDAGTNTRLTELQDIDATQIILFHKRVYRPGGSVLAVLVPDTPGQTLMTSVIKELAPWAKQYPSKEPIPPLEPEPAKIGLHWAEQESPIRFALVRELPEPTGSNAAATLIINELISWDGVGGRFGEALGISFGVEAGLESYQVTSGAKRYQVLEASIDAPQVAQAYAAWDKAIRSLRLVPPSRSEVKTAAGRARLRLLADQNDPGRWLGQATRAALTGAPVLGRFSAKGFVPEAPPAKTLLASTLEGLDKPETLELGKVARAMSGNGIVAVVIGGKIPEEIELDIKSLDDVFVEATQRILRVDPNQTKIAGNSYLEHTLEVLGGKAKIAKLTGFIATSTSRSGQSPVLSDQIWYSRSDRRLRRVRTILQTTIETKAWPQGGTETSGSMRFDLERSEAQNLFENAARHPILILSEYARGKSSYNLISERTVRDRRIAVLERNDPNKERLRLHIDVESGLLRAVGSRERRAGIGVVFVREEYRDYRSSGGLRVPYYRTAFVDNTVDGIVTEWTKWTPGVPTRAELGLPKPPAPKPNKGRPNKGKPKKGKPKKGKKK